VEVAPGTAGRPAHAELAALAATNPAARSLLLLEALARGTAAEVNLPYLDPLTLRVEMTPCR
jgi:hypothetical protein